MLETAYEFGAAVAFGIMGMAEAIRRTYLGYREARTILLPCPPISHFLEACSVCGAEAGVECAAGCIANAVYLGEDEEDPIECITCGKPWELVRPGKSQPTCECGG